VSGPHDFAVRINAVRYRRIRVHRIPPRVRDDREPPLQWDETAEVLKVIWVNGKRKFRKFGNYFCNEGWTEEKQRTS
jgi:hypothetical protein